MKQIIALSLLLIPSISAFAGNAPDCFSAIRAYENSTSEVESNELRPAALEACRREFRNAPKARRIVAPLLKACESLDGPTGSGDTGPHAMDSCKVDAYRYGLNFEI